MPSALLEFSRSVLRSRFSRIIAKRIHTFHFDRSVKNVRTIARIHDKLDAARKVRLFCLSSSETLFLLRCVGMRCCVVCCCAGAGRGGAGQNKVHMSLFTSIRKKRKKKKKHRRAHSHAHSHTRSLAHSRFSLAHARTQTRGIVVTTPEAIKSLALKMVELLHYLEEAPAELSLAMQEKMALRSEMADALAPILKLWKQGVLIMVCSPAYACMHMPVRVRNRVGGDGAEGEWEIYEGSGKLFREKVCSIHHVPSINLFLIMSLPCFVALSLPGRGRHVAAPAALRAQLPDRRQAPAGPESRAMGDRHPPPRRALLLPDG